MHAAVRGRHACASVRHPRQSQSQLLPQHVSQYQFSNAQADEDSMHEREGVQRASSIEKKDELQCADGRRSKDDVHQRNATACHRRYIQRSVDAKGDVPTRVMARLFTARATCETMRSRRPRTGLQAGCPRTQQTRTLSTVACHYFCMKTASVLR